MNVRLARLCAYLWLLGFAGMTVSKGVFDLGPGTVGFGLAARIALAGGLTYCLLGVLACLSEADGGRKGEGTSGGHPGRA